MLLKVHDEITWPFKTHLKCNWMLIYSNIGCICHDKGPELPLPTVGIAAEQSNQPQFVYLIKWAVNVDSVNRNLGLIQFLVKVNQKLLRLLPRVVEDITMLSWLHCKKSTTCNNPFATNCAFLLHTSNFISTSCWRKSTVDPLRT